MEIGNPASAQVVKEYLKLIRVEQAKSHVLPKQAKPIFLTKVSSFIDREIKIVIVNLFWNILLIQGLKMLIILHVNGSVRIYFVVSLIFRYNFSTLFFFINQTCIKGGV